MASGSEDKPSSPIDDSDLIDVPSCRPKGLTRAQVWAQENYSKLYDKHDADFWQKAYEEQHPPFILEVVRSMPFPLPSPFFDALPTSNHARLPHLGACAGARRAA